ncbi:MAG: HAD family phosphatase [Candidatus Aenigmatarchaeota archaeon]
MLMRRDENPSLSVMIRAVIFDIGGVVINDDFLSYAGRFVKKTGMSKEQIYLSVIGSPEWKLYFKGKISEERVWDAIKKKYLQPDVAEEIKRTWWSILVPIEGTIELIRKLKSGYKIYAISNVDRETYKYAAKKFAEIYSLFDGVILSFEVGMAKPEQGIYTLALKKFGLKPEECVYIDNQPENLPPAELLGMRAIRFRGAERLNVELKKLGLVF